MTAKKQPKKKVQIDIGLRLFAEHAEEISRAVNLDAELKGTFPSRNAFCAAAALAAARKVLKDAGKA